MSRLRLFPLAALLWKIHIVSYPTGHLMASSMPIRTRHPNWAGSVDAGEVVLAYKVLRPWPQWRPPLI